MTTGEMNLEQLQRSHETLAATLERVLDAIDNEMSALDDISENYSGLSNKERHEQLRVMKSRRIEEVVKGWNVLRVLNGAQPLEVTKGV